MLEVLGIILSVLGLFGLAQIIRFLEGTLGRWWTLRTWTRSRVGKILKGIISKHVVKFKEPTNVATYASHPINLNYFIDFLSASTNKKVRTQLELCASRWIKRDFRRRPDMLAVPKLGNVLFASAVADKLALPLVIVRQDSKICVRGGNPLEGQVNPGQKILLLDDVASDGEFLARCIEELQECQATVLGVLVLVNRAEGDAITCLSKYDMKFEYILNMSEPEIRSLVFPMQDEATAEAKPASAV